MMIVYVHSSVSFTSLTPNSQLLPDGTSLQFFSVLSNQNGIRRKCKIDSDRIFHVRF